MSINPFRRFEISDLQLTHSGFSSLKEKFDDISGVVQENLPQELIYWTRANPVFQGGVNVPVKLLFRVFYNSYI